MEKVPVIELFSIGTELILGQIQDTNAFWMAQRMLELGGRLRRITMVRDDFDEMKDAIESSIWRGTDLILTTGGLGPTPDDMTVEAVAKIIGKPTIVHEETLAGFMDRRELSSRTDVSPAMIKMATVPETAHIFQNPVGWAPCSSVRINLSTILMMPGPPEEMKAIFDSHVALLIAERYRAKAAALRVYVNMFESEVSPLLQVVMNSHPRVYLKAYIALRRTDSEYMPVDLVSTGIDAAEAESQLQEAVNYFRQLVIEKNKILSLDDA
ncbi:MAG: competence/damage-inducible protein A [Candidatus Poribacteria bacterium]|nr:competence/damage-inducible protein A [Candidatus Poribacteria bacterium]